MSLMLSSVVIDDGTAAGFNDCRFLLSFCRYGLDGDVATIGEQA